ncbi:MAG TPA: hypothetical protein VH392_10015, partial [Sphingomicrobium sp.]
PDNVLMRYNFACVLARRLNDAERAIDLLEAIVPGFSLSAYKATVADADLDRLRDHPRFQKMIAKAAKALGVQG